MHTPNCFFINFTLWHLFLIFFLLFQIRFSRKINAVRKYYYFKKKKYLGHNQRNSFLGRIFDKTKIFGRVNYSVIIINQNLSKAHRCWYQPSDNRDEGYNSRQSWTHCLSARTHYHFLSPWSVFLSAHTRNGRVALRAFSRKMHRPVCALGSQCTDISTSTRRCFFSYKLESPYCVPSSARPHVVSYY